MGSTPSELFAQGCSLLLGSDELGRVSEREAFLLFTRSAEEGHADAAFHLAACYKDGIGTNADTQQAISWLRTAVRRDPLPEYSDALCTDPWTMLNRSLLERWVTNPPGREDVTRYRDLAELGVPGAQAHLGLLLSAGIGLEQDDVVAVQWFQRAAESNNWFGCWMLAIAMLEGVGTPKDLEAGLAWLQVAAGHLGAAAIQLGELRRTLTDEAVTDLASMAPGRRDRAVATLTRFAEEGFVPAVYHLALMQLHGDPAHKRDGISQLSECAAKGHPESQYLLGLIGVNQGEPELVSFTQGLQWLTQAATQSHPKAQAELARVLSRRSNEDDS